MVDRLENSGIPCLIMYTCEKRKYIQTRFNGISVFFVITKLKHVSHLTEAQLNHQSPSISFEPKHSNNRIMARLCDRVR